MPRARCTGYASPEDVQKARAAGFDRHVPKPPRIDALQRVLTELLEARRRAPPSPCSQPAEAPAR